MDNVLDKDFTGINAVKVDDFLCSILSDNSAYLNAYSRFKPQFFEELSRIVKENPTVRLPNYATLIFIEAISEYINSNSYNEENLENFLVNYIINRKESDGFSFLKADFANIFTCIWARCESHTACAGRRKVNGVDLYLLV